VEAALQSGRPDSNRGSRPPKGRAITRLRYAPTPASLDRGRGRRGCSLLRPAKETASARRRRYFRRVRRGLVLALVLVALPAGSAGAGSWSAAIRAAGHYASDRAGVSSFAVIDDQGRRHGFREHARWYSASLLKPVIMGTLLTRPDVRHRPLTQAEAALLRPMIRRSADGPADVLFTRLRPGVIERFGRRHGLSSLRVAAPIWGSSIITAAGYARFFRALPAALPARHRRFALRLLRTIIGTQRWGVPRARPRGWALIFKGGWRAGRGSGRIVNQAALLACGVRLVTLTILTDRDPSHVYGTRTVEGIARRLLRPLGRCRRQ
jgi:hypothetical protein